MTKKVPKRRAGGIARSKALTKQERSEIAKRAAAARWQRARIEGPIIKAEFTGELSIGACKIPCAVLEDGRRVLSEHGITPFIDNELIDGHLKPIPYESGKRILIGFDAELLPAACDVWLRARQAGALQSQQMPKALQAEILMRGLAQTGIVALVDEATGYQEIRDRQALQIILDKYLTDEWSKWTKRFPDDFYRELFRLKGLRYPTPSGKKPGFVGHWTNDIVYSRLAPGVLRELRKKNPRGPSGHRLRRHHQHFTENFGEPELLQHLSNVTFLMKTCESDREFKRKLDLAAPKYGDTMPLNL